jgi:hypothetical protein
MKLSTAIAHFDTQLRADGKSECTRQAYLRDSGKLRCWLKRDVDVSTIVPNTLAHFLTGNTWRDCDVIPTEVCLAVIRVLFQREDLRQ